MIQRVRRQVPREHRVRVTWAYQDGGWYGQVWAVCSNGPRLVHTTRRCPDAVRALVQGHGWVRCNGPVLMVSLAKQD